MTSEIVKVNLEYFIVKIK